MKPFALVRARPPSKKPRASPSQPDSELKAGGVDLLDRMKEGLDSPRTVVSIAAIAGHDQIELGPPAKIGALATLARIAEDPGLRRVVSGSRRRGRRRRDSPDPAHGDARRQPLPAAALLVLPARGVRLPQAGRKRVFRPRRREPLPRALRHGPAVLLHPPVRGRRRRSSPTARRSRSSARRGGTLADRRILLSPRGRRHAREHLKPGEIVAAVTLPPPAPGPGRSTGSSRRRSRSTGRSSRPASSSAIDGGVVRSARVVFGSVAPTPYRSKAAEAVLVGGQPGDDLVAPRGRGGRPRREAALAERRTRRTLARVELERALRQAWA